MKNKKERSSLSWSRKARAKKLGMLGIVIFSMITLFVFAAAPAMDVVTFGEVATSTGIGVGMAVILPVFMIDKKFVELKEDDLKTFKEEATAEQLAEYFEESTKAKSEALQKLVDEKASSEDVKKLKDELYDIRVVQMKQMNEALKSLGLKVKKFTDKEKQEDVQPKSMRAALEGVKDALKDMADSKSTDWIKFKVATMLSSTNISGGNVPIEQRIQGLDLLPTRRIRLMDLVTRGVALSNIISWVSQANKDGSAGGTSEGALKNQLDFDLVVDSEKLQKRTAFIKVSDEMVDDIDFLNTEINNELIRELMLDIEGQVYEGDDIGNNLNGIRTQASAFVGGTFTGNVDNANFVDVLRVAMNQIEIANQEPATAILAHPSDVTTLLLIKNSSTDKRYIDALQIVAGQLMLDGIPIIKTTLVTQDEYLVGNFPSATVWDKGEIDVEVGLDGTDFSKNLRTIRAEWRGLNIIKTNKTAAFVQGTISTDAAVLETP